MKKTLFILALSAVAAQIFAFDPSASLKPAVAVGGYTKIEYQITEKFGDYYRSPKAKYVHVFDANGLETETSELTSKDAVVDKISYKYEGKNLVETLCTDADGKISWKINGKQVDESYYNSEGALLSKIITKYDDQERISEVAQYQADGKLEEAAVYTYNDAGKLSEISYTNGDNIQTRKVVFRFDASYQITEEQTYNRENKLIVRIIYRYDANGNIVKTTKYNVAEKFGTTVNELAGIAEYSYN